MTATVIFDLDGTLVDSSGDLILAANATLAALGVATRLDPAQDKATAFRGGRAMLRLGVQRAGMDADGAHALALIERGYPMLLNAYEAEIDRHTQPYPGAMEAVTALQHAGYKIGICTNKPAALAETLLTRLGWREAFASLVGADSLSVRKPHPDPLWAAIEWAGGRRHSALLVGDTDTDLQTGVAANIPVFFADFEPFVTETQRQQAAACFGHYDQLQPLVEGFFARAPGGTIAPL